MNFNDPVIEENVKARLKSAIKAAGGRIKISNLTGIPIATLNKQLSNMSKPSFDTVVRLSKALDISVDWLISSHRDEESPVETSMGEIAQSLHNRGIDLSRLNTAVSDVLRTLEANDGLYLSTTVPKEQLAAAIGNLYVKLDNIETRH